MLQLANALRCRGYGRDGGVLLLQVAATGQRRGRGQGPSLGKDKGITRTIRQRPRLIGHLQTAASTHRLPLPLFHAVLV